MLNNKGFAITTILYSLLLISILVLTMLLSSYSFERKNTVDLAKTIKNDLNEYTLYNSPATIRYRDYQNGAWMDNYVTDGTVAGDTSLGAINKIVVRLSNYGLDGDSTINYQIYTEENGWSSYAKLRTELGKDNQNILAVRFKLTGNIASKYTINYSVYTDTWHDVSNQGESAGSMDPNLPVKALKISLVSKYNICLNDTYRVSIKNQVGGDLTSTNSCAKSGEEVSFMPQALPGYKYIGAVIRSGTTDDELISLDKDTTKFTMVDDNVTIEAKYQKDDAIILKTGEDFGDYFKKANSIGSRPTFTFDNTTFNYKIVETAGKSSKFQIESDTFYDLTDYDKVIVKIVKIKDNSASSDPLVIYSGISRNKGVWLNSLETKTMENNLSFNKNSEIAYDISDVDGSYYLEFEVDASSSYEVSITDIIFVGKVYE